MLLMALMLLKILFEKEMELIGKLKSKDTSNIGILPSISKNDYIKLAENCLHIITNDYRLNGILKMKMILSTKEWNCDRITIYLHHWI